VLPIGGRQALIERRDGVAADRFDEQGRLQAVAQLVLIGEQFAIFFPRVFAVVQMRQVVHHQRIGGRRVGERRARGLLERFAEGRQTGLVIGVKTPSRLGGRKGAGGGRR